jgi:hypothetical protein
MGPLNTQDNPATTIAGVTAASITAAVVAILVLVDSFGWYDFDNTQYAAITAAVATLWAVLIPVALAIKGIAYAPSTVQEIKEELAVAPAVDPQTATALAK